jgi:hypothetical protein
MCYWKWHISNKIQMKEFQSSLKWVTALLGLVSVISRSRELTPCRRPYKEWSDPAYSIIPFFFCANRLTCKGHTSWNMPTFAPAFINSTQSVKTSQLPSPFSTLLATKSLNLEARRCRVASLWYSYSITTIWMRQGRNELEVTTDWVGVDRL